MADLEKQHAKNLGILNQYTQNNVALAYAWPFMPQADYWLWEGAKAGNPDVILQAMAEGAKVHSSHRDKIYEGDSALACASSRGHLACVKLLLSMEKSARQGGGSEFDTRDYALAKAAAAGQLGCCQELVSQGADPLSMCDGKNGLLESAKNGRADILENFLNFGPPDFLDRNGKTPLSLAAASGKDECIALLLSHGANANHVDHDGSTPLVLSLSRNHKKNALLLLSAGANPTLVNENNQSAPALAILMGDLELTQTIFDKSDLSEPKLAQSILAVLEGRLLHNQQASAEFAAMALLSADEREQLRTASGMDNLESRAAKPNTSNGSRL